jgi:hypothetical protein
MNNTSAATPANSEQNLRENLQKIFIQSLQFILMIACACSELGSAKKLSVYFKLRETK